VFLSTSALFTRWSCSVTRSLAGIKVKILAVQAKRISFPQSAEQQRREQSRHLIAFHSFDKRLSLFECARFSLRFSTLQGPLTKSLNNLPSSTPPSLKV
jgi:hypothetical protein